MLQVALFQKLGYIVRAHEPNKFYNKDKKDNVQIVQLLAVNSGFIGAVGMIVVLLLQQKIPTPIKYLLSPYNQVIVVGEDSYNDVIEEQLSHTYNRLPKNLKVFMLVTSVFCKLVYKQVSLKYL